MLHTVEDCLTLALTEPAKALVRLWRVFGTPAGRSGANRAAAEADAEGVFQALQAGRVDGDVSVAAALLGLDQFLAEGVGSADARSRLKVVDNDESFWVLRRREGWTSATAKRQPNQVGFWLRRHQIVPAKHNGITVNVRSLPAELEEVFDGNNLRVLAGGFTDGVKPDWPPNGPLLCKQLTDTETRWSSAEALLGAACGEGADVVVFPELTIDVAVRKDLQIWLTQPHENKPDLVVAGSFHEGVHNVAHVYDGHGIRLLRHLKIHPLRTVDKAGNPIDENIDLGDVAVLFHTPLGLVGVCICADFCESGPRVPVAELWHEVGPSLMLVPSMGEESTNRAHAVEAKRLTVHHGTATVVAGQHPNKAEAIGLIWGPKPGPESRSDVLDPPAPWLVETLCWIES